MAALISSKVNVILIGLGQAHIFGNRTLKEQWSGLNGNSLAGNTRKLR